MHLRMETGGAVVGSGGQALLVPLLQVRDRHPAEEAVKKEFVKRPGNTRSGCPVLLSQQTM